MYVIHFILVHLTSYLYVCKHSCGLQVKSVYTHTHTHQQNKIRFKENYHFLTRHAWYFKGKTLVRMIVKDFSNVSNKPGIPSPFYDGRKSVVDHVQSCQSKRDHNPERCLIYC